MYIRAIRIAFVSHVYWPEKRRGGERLIRDLSDELIARGHSARLLTSHRGTPRRDVEDGLEVVRQWRPPERPLNALGFPPGTTQLPGAAWALRRGDDDIAQAWTVPAAIAAAHSRKPSVFVFQGVLDEGDLAGRPRVRSMLMRAARGCDAVTTYSDVAAEAFTALTGVDARAIQPGIRLDVFTPGGERHPTPAIFCAADPDEPRKRVRLLVDAFQRLHPGCELWLMNTSDPAIANAPGVRIVDPGADRDELVRLYRSAWVTVLPAFREAFGLVVAESLACGTPAIVMRDGGGVLGITDALVADPDAESLARVMTGAIASPPPANARRDLSIARCADGYEALYAALAKTAA
ncbi:MAG: D-inositol-3-phosphate glycosyltransferase [Thermoleophilaceae bacterium]|nr:D-inositol-3-phosphate glycosyltransferase [Thermoleophilaceae bacterium]